MRAQNPANQIRFLAVTRRELARSGLNLYARQKGQRKINELLVK